MSNDSEFDPVAFMHQRTVQHMLDRIPYDINEDFIALAAESAKRQAMKDAGICRDLPQPHWSGDEFDGCLLCAGAIEREAGL